MIEEYDDQDALSPAAVSLIRDVISAHKSVNEWESVSVNARVMVRYLCGALSFDNARGVESAMVRSRESRQQLVEARNILDSLQKVAWAEVEECAAGDQFEAEVARAWMDLAVERVGYSLQGWQVWIDKGWQHILAQSRLGAVEAQAIWAAFLSFGDRLRAGLATPGVALARGGDGTYQDKTSSLPDGLKLKIQLAEMTSQGDLEVSANITAAVDSHIEVENQSITLSLRLNGEIWPLGNTEIKGGKAFWKIPEIQSLLSLPVGKISAAYLTFTFPSGENHEQEYNRLPFVSPVMDEMGKPIAGESALVTLIGNPRWEAGRMISLVSLPLSTLQRYPRHRLVIELVVAARGTQKLGEWPVWDWSDEPRSLSAASPGSAAIEFTRMSLRPSLHAPLEKK